MKTYHQRGVAAIELAFIISTNMVMLPAVALFAMMFFQYSVLKEATHDAAMYMATLPRAALLDETERARSIGVAKQMVLTAAQESGLTGLTKVYEVQVLCEQAACGSIVPRSIDVVTSFTIEDFMFSAFTGRWTDDETSMWGAGVKSTIPVTYK